jgi:hypothetical protein
MDINALFGRTHLTDADELASVITWSSPE